MSEWLAIDAFVRAHGVSRRTVYRWVRSGRVATTGARGQQRYRLQGEDEDVPTPRTLEDRVRDLERELERVHELLARLTLARNLPTSDTRSDTTSDTVQQIEKALEDEGLSTGRKSTSDMLNGATSDMAGTRALNEPAGDTRSDTTSDTNSVAGYADDSVQKCTREAPTSDTRSDTTSDIATRQPTSDMDSSVQNPVDVGQSYGVVSPTSDIEGHADAGLATPVARARVGGGRCTKTNKVVRLIVDQETSDTDGETWDGEPPLMWVIRRWNEWAETDVGKAVEARPERLDRLIGGVASYVGTLLRQVPDRQEWDRGFEALHRLTADMARKLRLHALSLAFRPIKGDIDETPRLFRLDEYVPRTKRKRSAGPSSTTDYHGRPGDVVAPLPFRDAQVKKARSAPDGGTIWDPTRPPAGDGSQEFCWWCHARRWLSYDDSREFFFKIYQPMIAEHGGAGGDVDEVGTAPPELHEPLMRACDERWGPVPETYRVPDTARG